MTSSQTESLAQCPEPHPLELKLGAMREWKKMRGHVCIVLSLDNRNVRLEYRLFIKNMVESEGLPVSSENVQTL